MSRFTPRPRTLLTAALLAAIACGDPLSAVLEPGSAELLLGEHEAGETVVEAVAFINTGAGEARVLSASLTGHASFSYAPAIPVGAIVDAGDRVTVELTWTAPDQPGSYEATLTVVSLPASPSAGGACGGTVTEEEGTRTLRIVGVVPGPTADDSDQDGLTDVVEVDVGTDPFDADSDDDGLLDGEDGIEDTDDDGLIDALDPDSDDDGLPDSLEAGRTPDNVGPATDTSSPNFVHDADPSTTTDWDLEDTDNDGLGDAEEDSDRNGRLDPGELDPADPDTDDDLLPDGPDLRGCTDPLDDDSDDDGLLDGHEDLSLDGVQDAGETDPCGFDSDGDGLSDGVESGLAEPEGRDTDLAVFVPDADPSTTTDPLSPDTDGGTVPDGVEDSNLNGAVDPGERDPNDPADDLAVDTDGDGLTDAAELDLGLDPLDADTDDDGIPDGLDGANDSDGDGLIDALDPDSDNDGIYDSVEFGLTVDTAPADTDTSSPNFVPDADPSTTTNPDSADSDGDGLSDDTEDQDLDGAQDAGETDAADFDSDDDGLSDGLEAAGPTDPLDDDSDDDGLLDGTEDADADGLVGAGETDPMLFDSDGDGLSDGLESGLAAPEGSDTDPALFVADADPSTTTNPLSQDTDGGTALDGDEDSNGNGAVDPGERDPNDPSDDLYVDADGDGFYSSAGGGSDCNDGDASINPAATEIPDDGIDQDCSGADAVTCFEDLDLDGFGGTNPLVNAAGNCTDPGFSATSNDCDDNDSNAFPGAPEVVGDGVDQDCNGADEIPCFVDGDGDGFGSTSTTTDPLGLCTGPGLSLVDTDCDDNAIGTYPGAPEIPGDGIDQDCNGIDAVGCFQDLDLDGYGSTVSVVNVGGNCTDPGYSTVNSDCDDNAIGTYPGAPETPDDGIDQNCNGTDSVTCFEDLDLDGFGTATTTVNGAGNCTDPGYSLLDSDCDDNATGSFPGAPETADDGVDQDCNGFDTVTCFVDGDLDGFGSSATTLDPLGTCAGSGLSTLGTDCNDGSNAVYPGAPENCNAADDDCDGSIDETGTCPGCNQGTHNGHTYQFCFNQDRSWSSAVTWCSTRGYYLTTINNAAEDAFQFAGTAVQSGQKWWMGFNDLATEGTFVWVGAPGSGYTNWGAGEPNNAGGNEDCGQLRRYTNGTWNDEPCSQALNFICEVD